MPGWGLEGREEITKLYEKLTGMICIFKKITYADILYGYLKYNIYSLKKSNLILGD